jgi:hypothetical protein
MIIRSPKTRINIDYCSHNNILDILLEVFQKNQEIDLTEKIVELILDKFQNYDLDIEILEAIYKLANYNNIIHLFVTKGIKRIRLYNLRLLYNVAKTYGLDDELIFNIKVYYYILEDHSDYYGDLLNIKYGKFWKYYEIIIDAVSSPGLLNKKFIYDLNTKLNIVEIYIRGSYDVSIFEYEELDVLLKYLNIVGLTNKDRILELVEMFPNLLTKSNSAGIKPIEYFKNRTELTDKEIKALDILWKF